jgi:hypothetical protein
MRGTKWLVAGVLALVVVGASTGQARAQAPMRWVPGERMTEALTRLMGTVRDVSNKGPYGYDRGVCLMAGFFSEGQTGTFKRHLVKGQQYAFFAAGESSARGIHLEVENDEYRLVVSKDQRGAAQPVIQFTAPFTGTYTMRARLVNATHASFVGVAVLRRGGFNVPVVNLAEATAGLIEEGKRVDAGTNAPVTFLATPGQWAVHGAVLDEGESYTVTGIQLGGMGRRVFLARGDDNATDIDLWAFDERGNEIGKDVLVNARPIVDIFALFRPSHGMKVKNVRSRGRSLVLSAILVVGR